MGQKEERRQYCPVEGELQRLGMAARGSRALSQLRQAGACSGASLLQPGQARLLPTGSHFPGNHGPLPFKERFVFFVGKGMKKDQENCSLEGDQIGTKNSIGNEDEWKRVCGQPGVEFTCCELL